MMDTKEVLEIALHSLQRIEHSLKEIEANSKQTDSDVWHTKRADNQKVTVLIRCNIISVGDIDTVKQEFTTEIWLSAIWKEPTLIGKNREEVIWEEQWHPRLVFTNAISVDKMETKHHLYEDKDSDDGIPYAAMNFRLKATFKEPMELYDFPFDCQDLTIRIMSDWPDTDVQFKKNMSIKDSIRIDTFTGAQEWDLHKHVISQAVDEDRELTGSHRKYPMYHITAHVQRRIGFYLWNVALIMYKASQKEMKAANQKYQELCQQINKTWTENMAKRQQRDEEKTVKYEINYVENDHHEIKRKKAKRSRVRPNESKDGKGLGRLKDPDRRRHDGDHSESTERQSKSQSAEYNIPI
ncbi:uncharacterized protein [Ptychodera flava]|uniref:uncharacterized protein isoform X4 n=1 Tax=Ptychodera flava TaxID=63121 RepID=UPI00396A6905